MFGVEFMVSFIGIIGLGLVLNFKFLLNITLLLGGSLCVFLVLLFNNNLLFGLIILLVYVGGMLLLFMYVSTMLGIWEESLSGEFWYVLVSFFFVWDLLGYSFYWDGNLMAYSLFSFMWFYVLISGVFLGLSLFLMLNVLVSTSMV